MSGPQFGGVGSRRQARERAIELAYEADSRECEIQELLDSLTIPAEPFAELLLLAVRAHRDEVRALISGRATGWSLDRMPTIDRLVMEISVAEMLTTDTPVGVVLSEAVNLASRYSTEESGRFVNGVLGAIARDIAE